MPNNHELQFNPQSPLLAKKQIKYQAVEENNSQPKALKIVATKAIIKKENKGTELRENDKSIKQKTFTTENNINQNQIAFNLNNLLDDLIINHVFKFLDHDSAANFALVNKRFFQLYVTSLKLYHEQWLKDLNSSNRKSSITDKRLTTLRNKLAKLKSTSNTLKFFGTCTPTVVGSSTGTLACMNKVHCAYISLPMLKFLIGAGSGVIAGGVALAMITYFSNQQIGMLNQEIEELESSNSCHSSNSACSPITQAMMR